ncbi:MAG: hypothetical protein KDH89_20805, partial [Anaerolineae bacterium]|nr:hypothetical protein [Anaerolineae bacterium]
MTDETTTQQATKRDDAWAKPVDKLTVSDAPIGAMNLVMAILPSIVLITSPVPTMRRTQVAR